jgi:rRNA-processing protein FCF1
VGTTYVVIDTNTWLHFAQPATIDWTEIVGATDPVILVPYTILQELDEKRYSSRSEVLMRRAATAAKFLASAIDSEDSRFLFVSDTPRDWAEGRLQQTVADDRLIAELLAVPLAEGERIVVVTSDIALRVKLRAFKMMTVELPDSYRLPDEADTALREAKSKLAKMESASPNFSVMFDNGTNRADVTLSSKAVVSDDEIERRRQAQRAAHYRAIEPSRAHLYAEGAQAEYDERWRLYELAHAGYIHAVARSEHRRIDLTFTVTNTGEVRASGVVVTLTFPPDMIIRWKPFFWFLLAPSVPQTPPLKGEARPNEPFVKIMEQWEALAKRDEPGYQWKREIALRLPSRKAKLRKTDDGSPAAFFMVGNMNQGEGRHLRTVQIELPDGNTERTIAVKWTAHAENMVGADSGVCVVAFALGASTVA